MLTGILALAGCGAANETVSEEDTGDRTSAILPACPSSDISCHPSNILCTEECIVTCHWGGEKGDEELGRVYPVDDDCVREEYCKLYPDDPNCLPGPGGCSSDSDCPYGYYCDNYACLPDGS